MLYKYHAKGKKYGTCKAKSINHIRIGKNILHKIIFMKYVTKCAIGLYYCSIQSYSVIEAKSSDGAREGQRVYFATRIDVCMNFWTSYSFILIFDTSVIDISSEHHQICLIVLTT